MVEKILGLVTNKLRNFKFWLLNWKSNYGLQKVVTVVAAIAAVDDVSSVKFL